MTQSSNAQCQSRKNERGPIIEVDPNDEKRIIITLTTGKKYAADRYCPHAGADLAYMGKVNEDGGIGPVLMCTNHFLEFSLEEEKRSFVSIHACPIEEGTCSKNKKLEW